MALAFRAPGAAGTEEAALSRIPAEIRRIVSSPADLAGSAELSKLYRQRAFQPLWVGESGPLPKAVDLVAAIATAARLGLAPEDYHGTDLQRALAAQWSPETAARFDLLLTDGFFRYGRDLAVGKVDPRKLCEECRANPLRLDLGQLLQQAAESGRVAEMLQQLEPAHPGYGALKEALARYRRVLAAGGWPAVPEGPLLEPGMRDPRIAILRQRLLAEGALSALVSGSEEAALFTPAIDRAVRRFQERHGLAPGKVGPDTLAVLNVPAAERVRQIELNLERWRWLPHELGARHVLVNVPDFRLAAVEQGKAVLEMRIIAGAPSSHTPSFSAEMTHLVLNPYWNVPKSIAEKEILPKARRNPGYLKNHNYEIVKVPGGGTRVRQRPGSQNALGKIKFLFPNPFQVYLHDTPARTLFARSNRTFSHGCIRIEKPVELAVFLLQAAPGWDEARIRTSLDRPGEQWMKLPEKIPVHLAYWTAWADDTGWLATRPDVYERDAPLAARLAQPRSTSSG